MKRSVIGLSAVLSALAVSPAFADAASHGPRACPGSVVRVRTPAVDLEAYAVRTEPGDSLSPYSCATSRRVARETLRRRVDYLPCTAHMDPDDASEGCRVRVRGLGSFTCFALRSESRRVRCRGSRTRSVTFIMRDRSRTA
jgi:hypothetical protein